jgi:hypothetical protein
MKTILEEIKSTPGSTKVLEDHLRELSVESLNIKNQKLKSEFEYFFRDTELDIFVFKKIINIINDLSNTQSFGYTVGVGGYGGSCSGPSLYSTRNVKVSSFKSDLCKFISNLVPKRLIFWILIKAFSEVNMNRGSKDRRISYNTVIEYYGDSI